MSVFASRQACFIVLTVVVAARPAVGQTQFAELPHTEHFASLPGGTEIVAADFDGDGIDDIVVGGRRDRLFRGDGAGGYVDVTAGRLPQRTAPSTMTIALHATDVDGDGDLDLLLGSYAGVSPAPTLLYENDGTGTFVDATSGRLTGADGARAIASGDIDGDGDTDLVFGTVGYSFDGLGAAQNRLYRNDGAVFTEITAIGLPARRDVSQSVVLVDVDGDGDVDLVTGSAPNRSAPRPPERSQLCLNDGAGRFTDVSASQLPAGGQGAVAATDFDGDGDFDLVFGQSASGGGGLYENDGAGHFVDVTANRLPDVSVRFSNTTGGGIIAPADVDGDGDDDLIFGSRLLLNDGAGTFVEGDLTPGGADSVTVSDCDSDGLGDLFFENGVRYLNGGGFFAPTFVPGVPPTAGFTFDIAVGDLDGDGDRDVVLAERFGRLQLNDGRGRFVDDASGRLPWIGRNHRTSVELGDIDGDGDLDVALSLWGTSIVGLFLNDGTGRFTDVRASYLPASPLSATGLCFGDVDGDDDLDLVAATPSGLRAVLYLNDGTGRFADATQSRMPQHTDSSLDVAMTDVDADGDLDLWIANWGQDRLYLNDGTGTFAESPAGSVPQDGGVTSCLAVGDVDGDGDVDLMLGVGRIGEGVGRDRLYLGDGNGRFVDATATQLPAPIGSSNAIEFGDLDEDGDLDLVLGVMTNCMVRTGRLLAYQNDGTGTFTDATAALLPALGDASVQAVALADLDEDGDLDVLASYPSLPCPTEPNPVDVPGPNRLLVNRLRHMRTPRLPRLGRSYELEVHAHGTTGSAITVAVPFLSGDRRRTTIPGVGRLGVDPAGILALPPQLILGGFATTTVSVPNDSTLVGAHIYSQTLILRWPGGARFTNVTRNRISR